MPGTGGRLGWNEPPPAEITTTLHSNTLPTSVVTRKAGSPIFSIESTISPRWKVGLNGLTCSISASVRPWPVRSEEHTSELQSHSDIVCRLLLEKNKSIPKDTLFLKSQGVKALGHLA